MYFHLTIPVKALPLNGIYSSFVRNGRIVRSKSPKYVAWKKEVELCLVKHSKERARFLKNYDQDKHYLMISYRFYKKVFTKEKKISKTSGDSSNLVKSIEDCIADFLGFDDSQVIGNNNIKIESKSERIEIDIEIKDLGNYPLTTSKNSAILILDT